jgi:hypothetical protein
VRGVNGRFSREALTAAIGEELMADADRRAAAAPSPSPAVLAEIRRIFGPVAALLAERNRPRQPRQEIAA